MSKKFQLKERGATYSNQDKGTADIKSFVPVQVKKKGKDIFKTTTKFVVELGERRMRERLKTGGG